MVGAILFFIASRLLKIFDRQPINTGKWQKTIIRQLSNNDFSKISVPINAC